MQVCGIGGLGAANGGNFDASMWNWRSGSTWAGIGIGAVAGGLGGWGFATAGPALAGTGFFSHFGLSGAVAAYGITGTVMGGAIGVDTFYIFTLDTTNSFLEVQIVQE